MAGTRRPVEADIRDASILFGVLGFAVGMIVGAWLV